MRLSRLIPIAVMLALPGGADHAVATGPVWGPVLRWPLYGSSTVRIALQPGGRLLVGFVLGMHDRPYLIERTQRTAPWRKPVRLSSASGEVPYVALNRSGAALAVWRSGDLWRAAERPAGGRWQPARGLLTGSDGMVGVALSDSGVATVVLQSCRASSCDITVLRRRGFVTGWGVPASITTGTGGFPSSYLSYPWAVALSHRGDVVVGTLSPGPQHDVGMARLPLSATAWSPLQTQPLPADAVGSHVAVAADATGRAGILWSPLVATGVYGLPEPTNVLVRLWPINGSPGPTEIVAPVTARPGVPVLGLSDEGTAAAAWTTDDGHRDLMAAVRRPAGERTPPELIEAYSAEWDRAAKSTSLVFGGGRGHLLWRRHEGPGDNTVDTVQLAPGSVTWDHASIQDFALAGSSTGYDGGPELAAASDGTAVAVSNGGNEGLGLQDYAVRPGPDPAPRQVVIQKRGVWTMRFRLTTRATIRGQWTSFSGRTRPIGPMTLGAGVHRIVLGASRPEYHELQGCLAGRGCTPVVYTQLRL